MSSRGWMLRSKPKDCDHEPAHEPAHELAHEPTRHRQAQHRARRPCGGRKAVTLWRGHPPRGDGPGWPDEALHEADLYRRACLRHRSDRAAAARRQLDDARGGRADSNRRRGGGGLHF